MRVLALVGSRSDRNRALIAQLREVTSLLVTRALDDRSAVLWLATVSFDVVVIEIAAGDRRRWDVLQTARVLPPRPPLVLLLETAPPSAKLVERCDCFDDAASVDDVLERVCTLARQRSSRRSSPSLP